MFFLRCVFWLGIVYASMSWPIGTFEPAQPRQRERPAALAQAAVGEVAAYCAAHAQACLAGAAHLDALVAATTPVNDGAHTALPSPRAVTDVPLPVPDPRRTAHARF